MGANGHLIPTAFNCVQCNNAIDMESMVLRPAMGVDEAQTVVGLIPWLERKEIGWWRGLYRTIRMSLFRPSALMKGAVGIEERRDSWDFAAWSLLITVLVCTGSLFVFPSVAMFAFSPGGTPGAAELIYMFAGFCFFSIVLVLLGLLCILVWGLCTQFILRLSMNEVQPISRTYRALCYSAGANVASIVPCLGWYVGWIWWVVSAVLMVRETHRTTSGRAAFAVITPPAIVAFAGIALYAIAIATVISRAGSFAITTSGPAGFGVPSFAKGETQVLLRASLDYSDERGALPKHPVELLKDHRVDATAFVSSETMTSAIQIRWPGLRLMDLEDMADAARDRKIQSFVDKLPPSAYAHRAGDFVFTCPGVDPATLSPDVWLVIFSPQPGPGQPTQTWSGMTYVGRADGSVVSMPTVSFQNSLQGQQTVRKKNGLPPLPKLSSITHAQPAVASGE